MTKRFSQFVVLAVICLLTVTSAEAQTSVVGTLTGLVSDATGAVIAGAEVKAKDEATGAVFTTKSGADGSFTIGNLLPGTYTVSVTMTGFKTGEFRNVKITVGQVYDLKAPLAVGDMVSTVVVEAGAEILETASTTIGTTITGKAIQTLPLSSRDALDLAILMPGAATTGRVRQTSFMGLPKGAINITMDGINVQDNILKSSDGFFTIIRPRVDSIEEFSISTAGQGADQASEGAVQIRFETKRGGNEYHGGGWWQHRNDFFNANYFFSNQKAPGVAETPRQRQRLNQFGGQVGGPAWKDKIFFFAAIDNYRNPSSQVRQRTILSPGSLAGNFEYRVTAIPGTLPAWVTCAASSLRGTGGSGPTCTANLFAMSAAQANPLAALVADPVVAGILGAVDSSRAVAGVTPLPIPDAHIDQIQFNNSGDATRHFPDLRLDYNITKSHSMGFVYHYNYFTSTPDFLNGVDQTYPVAPFNTNQGSQISNRNEWVAFWRWNMAANKSNELRWGLQSAPVSFFPDQNLSIYPTITNNLGSINVRPTLPLISAPFLAFNTQGRNTPIMQLIESFSWTRGKHSFTFGGNYTQLRLKSYFNNATHTAAIGLLTVDPGAAMFSAANLPGATTAQLGAAGGLYALLGGHVSSYTGNVSVQAGSRSYVAGGNGLRRVQQNEFGVYGQDSWRIFPSLIINWGVRWEFQGSAYDPDDLNYRVGGHLSGVFGPSGLNNFFQPGNQPGSYPLFELQRKEDPWYGRDMNNLAPNLALAWTPNFDNKLFNMFFGGPGKTVVRTHYSVTYTREGINNFLSIANSNPGFNAGITASGVAPGAACVTPFATSGFYQAGCLTLNNLSTGSVLQSLQTNPPTFPDATPFSIRPFAGQGVNAFDSDLAVPLVHNWGFGIQREINPNLVLELRYVGNHGQGLWKQDNINEVNIFENGFLQEFLNARSNLAICRASVAACTAAMGLAATSTTRSFSNLGLPGQVNVPILSAAFTGTTTGSQLNTNFRAGNFITQIDNGVAGSMANTLTGQTFACNMFGSTVWQGPNLTSPCPATAPLAGAFPLNFFMANPLATGGAFRFYNGSHSTYNGLTFEARHRPAKGLQFNANYTWSKAITNFYADSSVAFAGFNTLRNLGRDKGITPWDLRHAFKMQLIYELPFGAGKRWSSGQGWVNQVIGGWEVSAINRWQSGRVFLLSSGNGGTFNQNDPGVDLVGITAQQLQEMLRIRTTPTGDVFYFPASLIASNGAANTAFIRPCSTPGALCQRPFLYGPSFYRADISVIKNFKITEKIRLQYRAEFLNAFNNINFFFPGSETTSVPGTSATTTTFGRVTNAFRDVSTTDDNGGRIIQMVFRINF